MKRNIEKLSQGEFDILIIGGGINGCALANMAAHNRLNVALIEKGDFASGTSSKSTKLVHGGLRYLENFEFDLVSESLKERQKLLKSAPHLVKPLGFVIPVYKEDQRPLWMIRLGVWLYDKLSGKYLIKKHVILTPEKIEEIVPGIAKKDLLGGVLYYDAQMDDARLCLENAMSAYEAGAQIANYVEAVSMIKVNGKTVGVEAVDNLVGKTFKIHAKKVVCCVGPWTNEFMKKEHSESPPKVRTTKGAHIVYRGQVSEHAIVIPMQKDGRIFFVIPWFGNSLIGTTDTDYKGDLDNVEVEDGDIEYLFEGARRIFPDEEFTRDDIITTFAGLRPLVSEKGAPKEISRRHRIEESYSGILYVMGGKYTTYRKIAEDALSRIYKNKIADFQKDCPIYSGQDITADLSDIGGEFGVDEETVRNLAKIYGSRYEDVLKLIPKNKSLREPLIEGDETILAQAVYAKQEEMAQNAEDVCVRRLRLVYQDADLAALKNHIDRVLKKY